MRRDGSLRHDELSRSLLLGGRSRPGRSGVRDARLPILGHLGRCVHDATREPVEERGGVRRQAERRSPRHAVPRRPRRVRGVGGDVRKGTGDWGSPRRSTPHTPLGDPRRGRGPSKQDRPPTRRVAREDRLPNRSGHRGPLRVGDDERGADPRPARRERRPLPRVEHEAREWRGRPVPELMREGVLVGLGTDSPLSNNGMDVFADMKVAALLHKATRWDARVMSAQTVLELATIHAARALHADREIGSIEVGKRADLAVVSLTGVHTTPFYPETVIRHLVYNGRGSDVEATIVDGQVLMSGGVVRTVDEADVIARAQETARELFEA